jgi:acyl carrier protein
MGEPLDAVRAAVGFVCEIDPDELSAQTRFDAIGADSLVRVGVADVVERRLGAAVAGWQIDDGALARVQTLGELADHVAQVRSAAPASPLAPA